MAESVGRWAWSWVAVLAVWGALVGVAAWLVARALLDTLLFATLGELADANRMILLGCALLILAALGARWMFAPVWACILLGAPALLLSGYVAIGDPTKVYLVALATAPVTLAGYIACAVLSRPLRRFARFATTVEPPK